VRTEPRFPAVDTDAGHYESFYLKAAAPTGGRALWIRHTIHKRPGAEPTASIWFTLFDEGSERPRATKVTYGAERLSTPEGAYVRVGEAEIAPGRAAGAVKTEALAASWELEFEDRHEALRHLPHERMYSGSLPRTKLLSPHPGALFSGTVRLDGEEVVLDRWPGMVGHNWGSEHAERWIWLHGADFEGGSPGDFIDVGAGRIKLGPFRTPWIANGMLVLDGTEYRLGGLARTYGTEIDAQPSSCEFVVAGKGATVRGKVSAPRERFVGWVYADPDGGEHHTVNCSIADLEMRVERPSHKHRHLKVPGGAAYELGMRETDHGMEIQPYPDG
jgi:hypothetical protein